MPTLPSLRFFDLWRRECYARLLEDDVHDVLHNLVQSVISNFENPDEAVFLHALRALQTHLHNHKTHYNRFMKLSAIGLVIHCMAVRRKSPDVQAACCAVLAEVADEDEDCQREIVDREGVQVVLDALNEYGQVLEIQRSGFTVLRGLTLVELGRKEMWTNGVLDLLVEVLKHPLQRDELLIERVIAVAGRVVYESYASREKLGQLGIIELITAYMEEFGSSVAILMEAGLALRNLAYKCVANHDRMNESDSMDCLFRGLGRHIHNDLVAHQLLAAVSNMVSMDNVAKKRVLVKKAYVELLFKTLQMYARDTAMCRKIWAILIHLCAYDPFGDRASVNMVASSCVHEQIKAAPAIVESISNAVEENDIRLFVKMTRLVEQLCIFEPFRREVGEAGILDTLLLFLGAKGATDEQIHAVLDCVAGCLSGMDSNKVKFRQLKGSAVVLQVMAENGENIETNEKCIKLLDISIGGQNVYTKDLVQGKHELIVALMGAMARFRPCHRIQEFGLAALVKIACENEEDAAFMVQRGFRMHVEATVTAHTGKPAVESLGNQLLSLLVDKNAGRIGRNQMVGSSGTSVARRMSRSRNVGDRARARSRSRRSASPKRCDRNFEAGRRAVLAAKVAENVHVERQDACSLPMGVMANGGGGRSERRSNRATKPNLVMETIQE